MAMTSYLRKKLGDHTIGKASYTMPTTVYLALFASDPGDSGSQASEIVGTGYVRQPVTTIMTVFDAVTGIAGTTDLVNFGVPGSDWGTIAWAALMDAATVGNMLVKEQVPSPRAAPSGSRAVKFTAGSVTFRLI